MVPGIGIGRARYVSYDENTDNSGQYSTFIMNNTLNVNDF